MRAGLSWSPGGGRERGRLWNRDPPDRRVRDERVPGRVGCAARTEQAGWGAAGGAGGLCGWAVRWGFATLSGRGGRAGHPVVQAVPFRLNPAGLAKVPA
ncbi:hypothetical protein GCM10010206_50490 [Streptomyces cinerochromogenes]|nr:hypothetical protein GCM10010206_50490 [Streptomyces cinerochromogenes]